MATLNTDERRKRLAELQAKQAAAPAPVTTTATISTKKPYSDIAIKDLTASQRRERFTYLKTKTNGGVMPDEKIWSGGFFSDVMDAVQLPQFAITGILDPKVSMMEAIEKRHTPSKAFNLTGWSGFAADVVLDPLNFLGVGALSKLGKAGQAGKVLSKGGKFVAAGSKLARGGKAVERAVTLSGAVRSGQKSLLSVGIPGLGKKSVASMFGKTGLAVERFTADYITKGIQGLKRAGKGENNLGNLLSKAFGTLETAPKGLRHVNKLEKFLKGAKEGQVLKKSLLAAGRVEEAKALDMVSRLVRTVNKAKLSAKELTTLNEVLYRYGTKAGKAIKTTPKIRALVKIIEPAMKESTKAFIRTGIKGGQAGKVLPLIPTREGAKILESLSPGKVLNKRESIEQFGEVFKLNKDLVRVGEDGFAKSVKKQGRKAYANVDGQWLDVAPSKKASNLGKRITEAKKELNILTRGQAPKVILEGKARMINKLVLEKEAIMKAGGKGLKRKAVSPVEANKIFGKEIYKENALEALYSKLSQTGKINQKNKFIVKAAERFGKEIPKGKVIPEGLVEVKGVKALKGFAFEKPIAEALETTFESFGKPESVGNFLKTYDKALNFWKATATYVNIAFHSRNAVSNHWQMWLAGVKNPGEMIKGYVVLRKVGKAKKAGKPLSKVLSKKQVKFYKEFVDSGLGGTGRFGGDIERSLKGQNIIFKKGSQIGGYLEDAAKYSVYNSKRAAGWSPEAAAEHVRKFMFDYGDLTGFEKNVMKRVIPFYTWQRKNLPLQVAMLIEKPTSFSVIAKAKRALENSTDGEAMNEKLLPAWMREGYSVWLGNNPEGTSNFFNLEGFLPAVDIGKLARPWELPIEGASLLIKTPLELLTNYNTWREEPIEEYEGDTRKYYGFDMPAKIEHALRVFRPASEIEKALGLSTQTSQVVEGGRVKDPLLKRLTKLGIGTPLREIKPTTEMWQVYFSNKEDVDAIDRDLSWAIKNKDESLISSLLELKINRREDMFQILALGLEDSMKRNNVENIKKIKNQTKYLLLSQVREANTALKEAEGIGNQAVLAKLKEQKATLKRQIKVIESEVKKLDV